VSSWSKLQTRAVKDPTPETHFFGPHDVGWIPPFLRTIGHWFDMFPSSVQVLVFGETRYWPKTYTATRDSIYVGTWSVHIQTTYVKRVIWAGRSGLSGLVLPDSPVKINSNKTLLVKYFKSDMTRSKNGFNRVGLFRPKHHPIDLFNSFQHVFII
jgi:hypothetical protein